jgi:hypothetical protein
MAEESIEDRVKVLIRKVADKESSAEIRELLQLMGELVKGKKLSSEPVYMSSRVEEIDKIYDLRDITSITLQGTISGDMTLYQMMAKPDTIPRIRAEALKVAKERGCDAVLVEEHEYGKFLWHSGLKVEGARNEYRCAVSIPLSLYVRKER